MGTANSSWLEGWVEQWGDRLLQFVATYVRDRAEAEDIVQETFVRLYLWHRRYPDRPISPGWLYTTAWHRAVDQLRERQRMAAQGLEEQGDGIAHEERWVDRMLVETALRRLKGPDRECLWLFYYAELSTAEIAHHLGLKEPAVRARLMRARRRLMAVLGGER